MVHKEVAHKESMVHKHIMHKPVIKKRVEYDYWRIACVILAILFLASVFTKGFSFEKKISKEDAKKNVESYINTLMQGQGTATVDDVTESNGLYRLKLDVSGRKYDSFVTKDGVLLFPTGMNMSVSTQTNSTQQGQQNTSGYPKTDKPEVLLFTMAYCPYGNQAEDGIAPVVKAMGNDVEIQPHYVIYSNYQGGGPNYCLDKENKYCSMHGIQELNEDVRELCIYKYEKAKFWDFVLDVNTKCSSANVDTCWEAVAKARNIDTAKIKACQKDEALALLAKEASLNAKYSVQGSPALIINGADYSGARTPDAYKTGICSAFTTAPASCSQQLSSQGAAAAGDCAT